MTAACRNMKLKVGILVQSVLHSNNIDLMHSLETFYLFRKYFHNRKMSYIGIYIIKDTLGGR